MNSNSDFNQNNQYYPNQGQPGPSAAAGQQPNPYNPYSNPDPNFGKEHQNTNNYSYNNDLEKGGDNYNLMGANNVDEMMRLGFIRKVYGILTLQLLITVLMAGLTFFDGVKNFYHVNIWLFWTCIGLSLLCVFPIICCRSVARTVPTNYILMLIWTFCEAYMVATCCSFYEPEIVITAASLTCAVTVALTMYACTTKTDFTFLGGFLFVSICLLLFFGIFGLIFGRWLHTLYCVFGVLVYSIYLIYDTQLVMGKFGNEYEYDDYIIAAIMIYIDIIQIFLYLLQLFGRR